MEKEGEIRFVDEKLKKAFEELKESDKELYEELENAFENISKNVFYGRNVRKNLIPKELIQKHNLNNLWIYNLREGWRLIYFITSPDKIEVLAVILDWMSHKDYERLFKF